MNVVTQNLVAGPQRIQAPGTTGQWAKLKIANESPYDLTIQIAGASEELGPQVANVYPLNGANFIDITAMALQPVAGAPAAQLQLTWAQSDETIEGTYPMALVREVNLGVLSSASIALPVITRQRSYDTYGHSFGGTGTQSFVDFAGVVNKQLVTQSVIACILNTGGAASGATCAIHGGLNTTVPIYGTFTGFTATLGSVDRVSWNDLGVGQGVFNQGTRIGFEAGPGASNSESVSAAVYAIGAEPGPE